MTGSCTRSGLMAVLLVFISGCVSSGATTFSEDEVLERLVGRWQGPLDTRQFVIDLRFEFIETADGVTARLHSPDQGTANIPASVFVVNGDQVRLEFQDVKGVFLGRLQGDGATLTGRWREGGRSFRLRMYKE